MPAPKASERQLVGSSLPKAPITKLNEQPDSPSPIITPALRSSVPGVVACAISASPSAYSSGADHHHAIGAEAVGDAAGKRLADAPQQVLDRKRH